MQKRATHFYEFGDFRIDARERLLYRAGEVVPLSPKVFDTLLVFVEHAGHMLEKGELMQRLWPETFVEESSLSQNISLLRKALGEGAAERQYIETVPKRGYRFVAQVRENFRETTETETEEVAPPAPPPQEETPSGAHSRVPRAPDATAKGIAWRGRRAYAVLASILLCSLMTGFFFARTYTNRRPQAETAAKSLAVLPFRTLGAEDEAELLGLGMADALIIRLGRLPRPSVLPTGSVIKYTKREADALAIGRELGVDAVLDGTVQHEGDRVRVTAQLVRLSDGRTIWSGKFDRQYSSIFALQDSLSEQLAAALVSELTGRDRERIAGHPTQNTEAYEAYVMGLYFWNKRTEENLARAIGYLRQAIERDGNFAKAHAVLADCYYLCYTNGYRLMPRGEALRQAQESARAALVLDESIAEAHTALAGVKLAYREFEEADREFSRAIELDPNYATARVRYGYFLFGALRLEDAVNEMRRAQELDPASPVTNAALACMLRMARDDDASIRHARRALELQPDTVGAHSGIAQSYVHKGMFANAHAEIENVRETDPLLAVQLRAYAFAPEGRRAQALAILTDLERAGDKEYVPPFNFAIIYAHLGDKEKAFAWLEKETFDGSGIALLKFDPDIDPLRDDPRFTDLLRRKELARTAR